MKASELLYYAVHPHQLRAIIQWKIFHTPLHVRVPEKETPTLKRCFEFLDQTSRSFSSVIQELCPELCVSVSLFYLILRGLDTIEDDMTIPTSRKESLLRKFHVILNEQGWTFNGNGPKEKDRQLLVEFNVVIAEFAKLPENHRSIITDITQRMGNGMADYIEDNNHNANGVNTIADYNLYCHYVAGLVGDGLTRLFCDVEKANPVLLENDKLSNSMGLFLQKTNIIRDYREDLNFSRAFWPKEIWSKHVRKLSDLTDIRNEEAALNCISEMVLDSLGHATDCLFYLAGLKDQSVFNFAAIPQVMAISTLALVFRNKDVFQKNVKITKGEACELMMKVRNMRAVSEIFRKYVRVIHNKNTSKDPNFLNISIACAKVEQWIENVFPSTTKDLRTAGKLQSCSAAVAEDVTSTRRELSLLLFTTIATMLGLSALMIFTAWLAGARFDLALEQLKNAYFQPSATMQTVQAIHDDL